MANTRRHLMNSLDEKETGDVKTDNLQEQQKLVEKAITMDERKIKQDNFRRSEISTQNGVRQEDFRR